jgi:hypothetical protein
MTKLRMTVVVVTLILLLLLQLLQGLWLLTRGSVAGRV